MGSGSSKKAASSGDNLASSQGERRHSHVDTNPPPQSDVLLQCKTCNRSFASDRIERHQEVCSKLAKSKRDVFDVADQRLEGTEAEAYKGRATSAKLDIKKNDWKKTHSNMIEAIREAKKAPRPKTANDPPVDIMT